jgi:hypothetical protein
MLSTSNAGGGAGGGGGGGGGGAGAAALLRSHGAVYLDYAQHLSTPCEQSGVEQATQKLQAKQAKQTEQELQPGQEHETAEEAGGGKPVCSLELAPEVPQFPKLREELNADGIHMNARFLPFLEKELELACEMLVPLVGRL